MADGDDDNLLRQSSRSKRKDQRTESNFRPPDKAIELVCFAEQWPRHSVEWQEWRPERDMGRP